MNANAENIDKYFGKEDNVTRIYLNFSNPWPKDKHKKRRLTHITKLKKYLEFLSGKKEIYFKTDDYNFFEESREYFKEIGFKEEIIIHNLQKDDIYLKKAGIKNMIHTSSIAVLKAEKNQLIDETMLRDKDDEEINDYYRSKILSDEAVKKFLNENPDIFCCFVLPGFMFGPGDMGPTSSGQLVMDYVNKKIPGIIPSSYSVVDARDVAEHEIMAMEKGKRGELYLAAGKFMTMKELLEELSKVTGIPAPKRVIPLSFLKILAVFNELISKLTKKETLINKATIHVIKNDYMRNNFSHKKSKKELGCEFGSLDETLKDVINWYKENGYL